MGIFFAYILKSALCLSAFYLFYRWLLSKETFHRFNRIALLGLLSLSLAIPLIEVTVKDHTEMSQAVLTIEQLLLLAQMPSGAISTDSATTTATSPPELTISWIQVGLLLYLVGIGFFACRNLYYLFRIFILLRSGKREQTDRRVVLIVHEKQLSPFSWMKYIVISRKDLEENGREILIHERAHILNRHSIDLLIADLCIFFQWFNPGAWLLKQELQNIHEYEADETVLKEGVNAKQYQLLLIKKAVGTRLYSMANSFNHSKLKKRITMMLKEKSNPWARLKYLYVLPLTAVAVTAFARPEVSHTVEELSALKVNELASMVELNVKESLPVALPADTAVTKEKVTVVAFGRTKQQGKHAYTINKGGMSATLHLPSEGEKPLLMINGKESDYDVWEAIQPDRVKTMAAIPPANAKKYGAKAKNGVFEITLYPASLKLSQKREAEIEIVENRSFPQFDIDKGELIIINGRESTREELAALNRNRIKRFATMKGQSAASVYGEKGEKGVLLITTLTDGEAREKALNDSTSSAFSLRGIKMYSGSKSGTPLLIVDGVEKPEQSLSDLSIEQIESFSVLKGKSALDMYGSKGKDGVILITTKKAEQKAQEIKESGSLQKIEVKLKEKE